MMLKTIYTLIIYNQETWHFVLIFLPVAVVRRIKHLQEGAQINQLKACYVFVRDSLKVQKFLNQ